MTPRDDMQRPRTVGEPATGLTPPPGFGLSEQEQAALAAEPAATAAPLVDEPAAGPATPAAAGPKLPAGVSAEDVASWKRSYGQVMMGRVAGLQLIVRQVTIDEMEQIRLRAQGRAPVINEELTRLGVLWAEGGKSGRQASGFSEGVCAMIDQISCVGRGFCIPLVEETLAKWDELVAAYAPEKLAKINLDELWNKHDSLWAFFGPTDVYILSFVALADYERILEKNPEAAVFRMVQEAILAPHQAMVDLKKLPYGLFDKLQEEIETCSGFRPEATILL